MTLFSDSTYPNLSFDEAKGYFETAFLDYYGQANGEISGERSYYSNGAWFFNSPYWSSDGKTVTSYGQFRDSKADNEAPFGAVFYTVSTDVPVYPG